MRFARLIAVLAIASSLIAQQRPKILGDAHVAFYVSDLDKARAFYEDFLGFAEIFTLPGRDGKGIGVAVVKINDHQFIELVNEPAPGRDRLNHLAVYTNSAAEMRNYLAAQGVQVPMKVGIGEMGDKSFTVKDPEGHRLEFVEYTAGSLTSNTVGKSMPATRISDRMYHAGIVVTMVADETKFYHGILGFEEFWRGSSTGKTLSWINMRVPDGEDYFEFMLFADAPPSDRLGTAHHLCLIVPDAAKAVATLEARRHGYDRAIEMKVGINRKRQVNLYDPDGTRAEVMEPVTVDGTPAPSSTAPLPLAAK